jgi:RNA polymerase sigma-70 factor (ECF subfamily)
VSWSDGALVKETLAGKREAFSKLVERHRRTIYALALHRGFQAAEAEDVTQDVFVKAYANLRSLSDPEGFARWLYGIAGHVAADSARTRKRRSVETALEHAPEPVAIQPEVSDSDEKAEVMRAVAQLPEVQKLVITLRYLEGLSPKEIALRLNLPRGTVRSHLHHALGTLQTAFAGREQRVGPEPL